MSSVTYLVTGGGGYAGFRLGLELLKEGGNVILADVRPPADTLPSDPNITFRQMDIRNESEVLAAFFGADCIFHLASYGMSGREMLNRKQIEAVNIRGTENVIRACKKLRISRLIYTSTFNVVFGGQTVENGDETLPYFPIEKHPDYYSRTKTVAERAILAANDTPLEVGSGKKGAESGAKGAGQLSTCALRLAGVYGPGEQRHLPRIVNLMEQGMFRFQYGSALVEFLHVDNLVQAHIKAAHALLPSKGAKAAGKAYFISDGAPINNFLFFKPLCEGLGFGFPTLKLPLSLVYYIAFLTELVHWLVAPIYNFQPLLTRAEVFKTGVTHWFNLDAARKDLGYQPTIQNDLSEVVEWFKSRGHGRPKRSDKERLKRENSCVQLVKDLVLAAIFAALIMALLRLLTRKFES